VHYAAEDDSKRQMNDALLRLTIKYAEYTKKTLFKVFNFNGYDTIRYDIFTCAQKLTKWPP